MQKSIHTEKKAPVIPVIALMAAGLAVILVFTLTPWNILPVSVTENVTVLAITEHGCVGESVLGLSVVVANCDAQIGDTVSATFNVPAMEINGFYDKIDSKLAIIEP